MKIILLADNNSKREKGLMWHRPLDHDECAFFYFEREASPPFWNKNVDFPISLLFLNKNGVVEDIKKLERQQTQSVKPSSNNIKYVIEANEKTPEIYGIKIGTKVDYADNRIIFEEPSEKKSNKN